MDREALAAELRQLGKDTEKQLSKKDYYHMRAIDWLGKGSFLLGVACCYWQSYILSSVLIAFSLMIGWLLMHHIGHGGYNKIPDIPKRFHSKHYAIGWRRYVDWFDWIKPEAWNYEHNYLHHAFTGELKDPDLVEENLDWLAKAGIPVFLKLVTLVFFALTWKVTYYSARTLSCLRGHNEISFSNFIDVRQKAQRIMWFELFIPYFAVHFVVIPLLLEWSFGIGTAYLGCRIAAELLHNLHTFVIIVPNHAGEDLYRFHDIDKKERGGAGYFLRQITGSVNYHTGNELLDLSQMYLNYQIEHHVFPALPMRQYRLIQPKVKQLCEKYGVPYIQESIWQRVKKMANIAIGKARMKSPTDDTTIAQAGVD